MQPYESQAAGKGRDDRSRPVLQTGAPFGIPPLLRQGVNIAGQNLVDRLRILHGLCHAH